MRTKTITLTEQQYRVVMEALKVAMNHKRFTAKQWIKATTRRQFNPAQARFIRFRMLEIELLTPVWNERRSA